jgi:NAD(P)-dependent dehydrogenase (short-subunit alcohol dehydrogenase family)
MYPPRFEGRVALVTGGTSGIGRAAARVLAAHGARVVVAGRRRADGEETVAQIRRDGGHAAFKATDVTRGDEVADLVRFAVATFGRLDIAFNNAGYQERRALLAEQPDEAFDTVFGTNVRGLYYCLKYEIAHMREAGGGVIINNASVSGVRNPNPGLALYSASKSAVISLTRSAALEYAAHRIRINAVAPGRVRTDMLLGSGIDDMARVAASLPLGRLGEPDEVAAAVLWLASDAASFVAGHTLHVDGGFLAQ